MSTTATNELHAVARPTVVTPLRAGHALPDRRPWMTRQLPTIDLATLNAKAAMVTRLDNKYVVDRSVLERALPQLAEHFDVLDIDGVRDFTYDTCYFDDALRTSYFDHQRKRLKRWKVRTRHYVDSGTCFVEVKLKYTRGVTVKKRMPCAVAKHGFLDATALAYVRAVYGDLYGREFDGGTLEPSMRMRYSRMSFVARDGHERMTVDHDLAFFTDRTSRPVDKELFIVETKSVRANGVADKILRSLHQHPVRACSKYCISMAALGQVERYNRFLPALKALGLVQDAFGRARAGRVRA